MQPFFALITPLGGGGTEPQPPLGIWGPTDPTADASDRRMEPRHRHMAATARWRWPARRTDASDLQSGLSR